MSISRSLARPRWGYRTGFWQPRNPAFWLFSILVLAGIADFLLIQLFFASMSSSSLALSWFLVAVYAIPMLLVIYHLDLYEREPLSLVTAALLWGAFVATMLSGLGNEGWGLVMKDVLDPEAFLQWRSALTAPFVEEAAKACGVVLLYLIVRAEFDDVMDGFVFGAVVGLGFSVVEDVFYFFDSFGGTVEGVLTGFVFRVVLTGVYGHALYTGLAGIGIAYFVTHRSDRSGLRRTIVAVGLFAVAVFAHFLWNSPLLDFFPREVDSLGDYLAFGVAGAIKGIPFLAFGVLMVVLSLRRERRWLRAALAGEPERGMITLDELDLLARPVARLRARWAVRRENGKTPARVMKRLQRAQINLAMVRTRVEEGNPDLVAQREVCKSLRNQLADVRRSQNESWSRVRASE